ncbi:MAG: AcvB/VirJ family lysyl-phosphatidylglycerol hydrolase [Bacteroidia bacterium]
MNKYCITVVLFLLLNTLAFANERLHVIEKNSIENDATPLAVLYTGDGGWRPYDEKLADSLNNCGIAVIGINSLDYFRQQRNPKEAAEDLAPVILHYMEKWNRKKIILIGYSFGAEVLPFIYNQLPSNIHSLVQLIVLLSPSSNSDFETHLLDRLGILIRKWDYDVFQEIASIKFIPILIFWGREEDMNPSINTFAPNSEVYYLASGHDFNDAQTVVGKIVHSLVE